MSTVKVVRCWTRRGCGCYTEGEKVIEVEAPMVVTAQFKIVIKGD